LLQTPAINQRDTITGEIQGKYFRTNLRMDYSFSNKGAVYLKINNLFNAKFHGAVGYPVDPLSLYVGIKHHY
jgi:outer membrane cobalamin receptor